MGNRPLCVSNYRIRRSPTSPLIVPVGKARQAGRVGDLQILHDVGTIGAHGRGGHAEQAGDLVGCVMVGDETKIHTRWMRRGQFR